MVRQISPTTNTQCDREIPATYTLLRSKEDIHLLRIRYMVHRCGLWNRLSALLFVVSGIIKEESQPLFSSADMCCTQHPTPATSSDSAPLLHGNDPNGGVSCGKQDMHTWTADDSGTTPFANLESQVESKSRTFSHGKDKA